MPLGGGSLIFSSYVGSGPASTLHPIKISGLSSTPKNIWNFNNPPKISPILYMYLDLLEKTLKCIEITPKYSPILLWTKNIHQIFLPPKIFIFLKTPKNIEIQNFEPQKWPEPKYVRKYQRTPFPGGACWTKSNLNETIIHLEQKAQVSYM